MSLSQGEMKFARSWIGDETVEADVSINERFDRYFAENDDRDRALGQAIQESMRARLTTMTQGPASVTLPGGLSFSQGQNMTTLMAAIRDFRSQHVATTSIKRARRSSMR